MGQTYCADKKVKIMKNRYEKPPANPHEDFFLSFCKKFVILNDNLRNVLPEAHLCFRKHIFKYPHIFVFYLINLQNKIMK